MFLTTDISTSKNCSQEHYISLPYKRKQQFNIFLQGGIITIDRWMGLTNLVQTRLISIQMLWLASAWWLIVVVPKTLDQWISLPFQPLSCNMVRCLFTNPNIGALQTRHRHCTLSSTSVVPAKASRSYRNTLHLEGKIYKVGGYN